MECHRPEPEDGFARLIHWLNVFFETSCGWRRLSAKLAVAVYVHGGNRTALVHPIDIRDKAAVVHVRTYGTDTDYVESVGDIRAGANTQGRVSVTGGKIRERSIAISCVTATVDIAQERLRTSGRVGGAGGVA